MWKNTKAFFQNDNPDAQIKWSLYGQVWKEYGQPYWKWIVTGVICTILASAAEAYTIWLVKEIVEGGIIPPAENVADLRMTVLIIVGLQLIAAYALKGVFTYAKVLLITKAGLLGNTALRRRVYKHMVRQPMSFFHGDQTGPLMTRFTVMADAVLGLVTQMVITIVQSVATIIFMVGLMLWFAPLLSLVLLVFALVLIPLIWIMRKLRVIVRASFSVHAVALAHITQTILGIKTIQSFGTEEAETKKMESIEDKRVKVQFKFAKLVALQSPLLEMMISIGIFFALVSGGYLIIHGAQHGIHMGPGDFLGFLLALTVIYKPVKALTSIGGIIQRGLIAAENVFTFLETEPEIKDAPDATELPSVPMNVKFDHISFAYNDADGNVLHDVSFEVKPGTTCALVGPSGGGKSTMFNLIGRFYDSQQGTVLINGTDIREFTLASLRSNIAMVSQDVFLFDSTIAENIKYGSPEATQEQIESAAKAANAHEFVMGFPLHYDNPVGERGTLLSGGQKQRIAIARAVLKDAPILLLDEATSALDSESEQHIQEALKSLIRGRTTFVIAHRLSTILDADIICVIKDGRIVERGTDAELYALGGEYRKLKDIQYSDGDKMQERGA